jgi:biofilm PGA synthesis lipoprotein PgaB
MYESGIVDIQSHSHNGHQYTVRNEEGKTGGILAYRTYDKNTGFEPLEIYNKRVVEDLRLSIDIIKKYTGSTSDTLCFPYGHYNTGLAELGKEAGFKYFVTTAYGYNRENVPNTHLIKRIRSGDSNLTTDKLKQNIIICGQGRPATQ